MLHDDVDGILVDSDEDGFHLIVSGMEGEYNFRLGQDGAIELLKAVLRDIQPWYAEGQAVLSEMTRLGAFRCNPDESAGFAIDVDHYDSREGK